MLIPDLEILVISEINFRKSQSQPNSRYRNNIEFIEIEHTSSLKHIRNNLCIIYRILK